MQDQAAISKTSLREQALSIYRERVTKANQELAERRIGDIDRDKEEMLRQLKAAGIAAEATITVEEDERNWTIFAQVEDLLFRLRAHGYNKILALVDEAGCPECGARRVSRKITDLTALGSALDGNWDYHECLADPGVNAACLKSVRHPPSTAEQLAELIEQIASNAISKSPIIERLIER